ncbi:G/T mismatch-specific thymine DNA glycosylase [Trametes pubescens]|uniref:G/T mismatch-specific thymine DNA glycosylase n=1 Tax=Trametes pubescens TaxID=154538 RepID=A0A1M2VKY1_TRAPU|nr:G/T mismatch-specific thymine DNA glycosylase [Trametes pubescens]
MATKVEELEPSVKVESSANTPTQLLRNALFRFRFDAESTPSLRRSPRNHGLLKAEEAESELPSLPAESRPSRKRSVASRAAAGPALKKAKVEDEGRKPPRAKVTVAPPEKYAHLNALNDHLGQEPDKLDVMFCGINPGKRSATIGHHFAHPTNHFWRCLHGAQLTDRLLDATEDGILPESYQLGLTKLTAELANTEYTAGVPALLRKIVLLRPRMVCFVGKQIWESFIKAAAPRTSSRDPTPSAEITSAEREVHAVEVAASAAGPESSVAQVTTTRKKSVAKKRPAKQPLAFDLQPYKVVHPDQKIKQFQLLKQRVDELKSGSLDTSGMTILPIPPDLL